MLLSLPDAASGSNLQAASHVIFIHPMNAATAFSNVLFAEVNPGLIEQTLGLVEVQLAVPELELNASARVLQPFPSFFNTLTLALWG